MLCAVCGPLGHVTRWLPCCAVPLCPSAAFLVWEEAPARPVDPLMHADMEAVVATLLSSSATCSGALNLKPCGFKYFEGGPVWQGGPLRPLLRIAFGDRPTNFQTVAAYGRPDAATDADAAARTYLGACARGVCEKFGLDPETATLRDMGLALCGAGGGLPAPAVCV